MKKTLALLLALLMIFSVVLVSCGEDEEPVNTDDDFIFTPGKNTGTGTNDSSDKTSDKVDASFSPASGTVYFLYSFKVRKEPKSSDAAKNIAGTVAYASSAELVEKNDKWSKIKFTEGGITQEGYVYNATYTTDVAKVTLVSYGDTPKSGTAANLGTSGLRIRTTPWNCSNVTVDEKYTDCNIQSDIKNGYCAVKEGTALTIVGEVKNAAGTVEWYYVQCTVTGKDNKSYKVEGYAWYELVAVEGATTPTTPGTTETTPVITPV